MCHVGKQWEEPEKCSGKESIIDSGLFGHDTQVCEYHRPLALEADEGYEKEMEDIEAYEA